MKAPKYTVEHPDVIKRCINPVASPHSMICPFCGTPEVFCDATDKGNSDKWFWAIKAYKIDNWSSCNSCDSWFNTP